MDDADAHSAESRTPTLADLVTLCRELNAAGARYIVVGGFAIIQHGYYRSTGDIDLVVEDSPENQRRVRQALANLPQRAILELGEDEDFRDWVVLRVSDAFVVDVMTKACGIGFTETVDSTQVFEIEGVPIPFASPRLLLRMKQTHRASDVEDRIFLHRKIAEDEKNNK